MLSKWTEHLKTPAEKEAFRRMVLNDGAVLDRLHAIVTDLIEQIDTAELSIDNYASPSFAYLQADRIGEKRGLRKILALLTIKE